MLFRRAKATSEQGQPGVRCPITQESSGVVSLPSEPPRRASPTSALLSTLKFVGLSTVQASTFFDLQSSRLSRSGGVCGAVGVRLVRSRRPSGRGAQESTVYSSTRCACRRRSHAKHPEPAKVTSRELPQRQHEGHPSTERTQTTECARIPPRSGNPHCLVRYSGHKGADQARSVR